MKIKTTPALRIVRALSPPLIARTLCVTVAIPFAPFVAGSSDQSQIESETDRNPEIDEPLEDDNEYNQGLVWIVETEVIQLDLPPGFIEESGTASGREKFHESSIELAAQWYGRLTDVSTGFIDVSLFHERIRGPMRQSTNESFIELNEIWIENHLPVFDSSIRVGLQNFEDDRGWWWDDELVGAQWLSNVYSDWKYSAALLKSTNEYNNRNEPADPEEQGIYHILIHGQSDLGDNSKLSLYGIHSTDRSGTATSGALIHPAREDESDMTSTHLGLRVEHDLDIGRLGSLSLRGDFAIMRGNDRREVYAEEDEEESDEAADRQISIDNEVDTVQSAEQELLLVDGQTRTNINAWAADLGIYWTVPVALQPVIELGVAIGSGTSAHQEEGSKTFRQTALHDNRLDRGLYGNILVPELSNLTVISVAATIPIADTGDVTLFHHRFRKMRASGEIAESELDIEGTLDSSDIGNESGLYLQFDAFNDTEFTFSFSQFRYGKAITGNAKSSIDRVALEISYEF